MWGTLRRGGQIGGWGSMPVACPSLEITASLRAVCSLEGLGGGRNQLSQ